MTHSKNAMAKKEKSKLPRVLFVVGQTSSSKTSVSMQIARMFSGEIINADARQVYKGFTIGTGKPPGRRGKFRGHNAYFVRVPYAHLIEEMYRRTYKNKKDLPQYSEVPHYLMDFLPPEKLISVAEWRERAVKAIKGITRRGHLPIVVGGTGLYIKALIDNFSIPKVPPNPGLRSSFEKQPLDKLVNHLLTIDPSADTSVDLKNQRRVIRAIEICTFTGKPIKATRVKKPPIIDAYQIAIKFSREEIRRRIDISIDRMMEEGWPEEVRKLHKNGISWLAPAMTSIGYRDMARYIKGEIMIEEAIRLTKIATYQYAKRQETWFKRDPRIHWVNGEKQAVELVTRWMEETK
ncbi:tRNA (adenosine(37)-N6)-dimethylallyltransferase MiaA [Patescibacteria group bacterium]|nr:tRNA (adenosine(37)-N6)-dimethylallyltransferase MiaA [Patescibacteria group bacterium]